MSTTLLEHQQLCDEIYHCVRDENRLLRQDQRAPDSAFLARKKDLLQRLDASLAALRAIPAGSIRAPDERTLLERTRTRILQVLQLDKENEQLLLRVSLGASRPTAAASATSPSVAMLQKIYARCS